MDFVKGINGNNASLRRPGCSDICEAYCEATEDGGESGAATGQEVSGEKV